jgi:hypothetical protein
MVINSVGQDASTAVRSDSGANPPNTTLEGHKLLLLTEFPPPEGFLDQLKAKFPALKTAHSKTVWSSTAPDGEDFTDDDWRDVTILLTGHALPASREVAPKLEYIQLLSAGANTIVKHPLFTDTDIAFCTANGVHG